MSLNINLEFDAAAQAAPASFRNALVTAASMLDAAISNPITVNINVQYNENGIGSGSAAGGPSSGVYENYSTVRADLVANAAPGDKNFNALPSGSTINGQSQVAVWSAQEKLFGMLPANGTGLDGSVNFSASIPTDALVGVALHELTHAMGRSPYGPIPDIFDFYRYTSPGNRLFENNTPASASAYFSVDGGYTHVADYGVNSDPSDFLNTGVQGPNDPFNESYTPGSTFQYLTNADLVQLDALGFNPIVEAPPPAVHTNNLAYSGDVTGPYDLIDLPNLEASYGDLINAFGTNQNAMQSWYNSNETVEQRVDTFDGLNYVASYGDLISAFKTIGGEHSILDTGAMHYIQHGHNEGRTTTFNGLDYIASYGDLISAFGVNGDAGAYHYIEHGVDEGRKTSFDGLDYIASYNDLISAFGANEQAGAAHFIQHGYAEGRTTTFDGLDYIAGYTDLMSAFGANGDEGAAHYIDHGLGEGRVSNPFNVAAYEAAHPDLNGRYANDDAFLAAYINTFKTTGTFLT